MTAVMVPDRRARTPEDVDYARVHARTVRALRRSLRTLCAELAAGDETAPRRFVARHTRLMVDGFREAYREGAHDYAGTVSATPTVTAMMFLRRLSQRLSSAEMAAMRFYLPSVAKMAAEAAEVARGDGVTLAEEMTLAGREGDLRDNPALRHYRQGAEVRLGLQADVTWAGFQAGFIESGALDKAKPYIKLYWVLEPMAKHCEDCPAIEAKNPYDPPGGGYGGNILGQTPGDGQTACGARCRCDLEYGPPADANAIDWFGMWPENTPLQELWPEAFPPLVLGLPGSPSLTETQKRALDEFRKADALWDRYRGALPPLPDMFDPETGAPDFRKLNWNKLTEKQREALVWALEALGFWIESGGGTIVWRVPGLSTAGGAAEGVDHHRGGLHGVRRQ